MRTRAVFSANPNIDWLPPARAVYEMLRRGTCAQALYPGPWGLSSVQQVTFPYLVTVSGEGTGYVPGTAVHGLQLNLHLQARTFNWVNNARAAALLDPLRAMGSKLHWEGGAIERASVYYMVENEASCPPPPKSPRCLHILSCLSA